MFQTNFNSANKLWSGKKCSPIYNPKASIGQIVLDALNRNPEKVVQVSDNNGIELTADEIRVRTIQAAQRLQRLGFKSNDVFGFMTRNNHNVAPLYFAALCLGCPINALDPEYKETEVVHMFGITQPRVVFCEQDCYEVVAKSLQQLGLNSTIFTLDGNQTNVNELFGATGTESDYVATEIDAENHIAAIIGSAETAESTKGVSVSHAALMDIATCDSVTENDVTFTSTTLFWLSGIYMLLSSTIFGAKRIITNTTFSPEYLAELIEKYKFTRLHTATNLLPLVAKCEKIRETDLSSVKYYLIGGRNVVAADVDKMNNFLSNGQVVVGYGITGIGFVTLNRTKSSKSSDSCGSLKNNLEAKIVGPTGNRLNIGENGELCVRTPSKLLGFYKNPRATQELFDDEGFVLTGDIGHFDNVGYLHLVERKHDGSKLNSEQTASGERKHVTINDPASEGANKDSNGFWDDDIFDFGSRRFPRSRLFDEFFSRDRRPRSPFRSDLRERIRQIVANFFD